MVLALTNIVDSNWDTVWWVLGGLACVGSIFSIALAIRKRSLRIGVWGSFGAAVVSLLLAPAWHYFGWDTEHTDTSWSIRRHRLFGRVTKLAYDTNSDWFADAVYIYRYSDPWDPDDARQHHYVVGKEDRNYDGRWDTWLRPIRESRNGENNLVVQADTDLDGRPDYEYQTRSGGERSEEYAEIERRRGF